MDARGDAAPAIVVAAIGHGKAGVLEGAGDLLDPGWRGSRRGRRGRPPPPAPPTPATGPPAWRRRCWRPRGRSGRLRPRRTPHAPRPSRRSPSRSPPSPPLRPGSTSTATTGDEPRTAAATASTPEPQPTSSTETPTPAHRSTTREARHRARVRPAPEGAAGIEQDAPLPRCWRVVVGVEPRRTNVQQADAYRPGIGLPCVEGGIERWSRDRRRPHPGRSLPQPPSRRSSTRSPPRARRAHPWHARRWPARRGTTAGPRPARPRTRRRRRGRSAAHRPMTDPSMPPLAPPVWPGMA